VFELHQAMLEQFGEGWFPALKRTSYAVQEPARITDRSDRRATASYRGYGGTITPLQLVQVGDRWWISGYTFDDDPALKNLDAEQLAKTERLFGYIAPYSPAIAERVRRGEFSSADEARRALFEIVYREHPEYEEEMLRSSGR
jgi:hypothetical protein